VNEYGKAKTVWNACIIAAAAIMQQITKKPLRTMQFKLKLVLKIKLVYISASALGLIDFKPK
jgi:hypothetical protein